MDATNRLRGSGFWYTDLESANDAIAELRVRLDQRTARMAEYERVAIDESNSASMAKRERNAALAAAPLCPRCANRDNCCVATLDRFHDYDFARCKMFVEEPTERRTR